MGFLKPDIETRQPKSQATPLSQDVLNMLRQALSGGNAGAGFSTGQQEASAGVSQYVKDRQSPEQFEALMGPLREAFNLQTDKDVASTREAFGAMGNRFSGTLAREEGRVRGEANTNLNAQLAQLFLGEQSNLLNALGLQQQMGTQNMQPFFDFAGLGVLPEQTIVQDNPFMTILKTAIQAAGIAKGGG